MMHKFLAALLVAVSFLVFYSQDGHAQIGMQTSSGSQNGGAKGLSRSPGSPVDRGTGLAAVPEDFAQLRLAPGFLVGLNVLDDSDFQGSYRVDQDGNLVLPILGTMHVAGETASEARTQIRKSLIDGRILNDPQVDLSILEYMMSQVTVFGEVGSPGKYPLLTPHKLVEVLALAGGLTSLAGNEVQITPASEAAEPLLVHYSKATDPKSIENVLVKPGDTVQVKRAGIIYVLGAVNRPGGYVMQEEGTLNMLQAISLADGTAISAATKTVYILRKNADGTEVDIALPYKKISQGKSADMQLHATDILYVPTSTVKAILTNSQSILSSAASASIYAVATH
jgi:polysaccharide export outer membrane protein